MKNETVRTGKLKKKIEPSTVALPWWTKELIAGSVEIVSPKVDPHHIHYCSDCGCVLISTDMAYRYAPALCPGCGTKKRSSQGGN